MKDNWFSDESNFWKHRAIFEKSRVTGKITLDFLPDRGGFKEGERTERRLEFVKDAMSDKYGFKDWLQTQSSNSEDIFVHGMSGMKFRATCNRSYGYMYLWAFEEQQQ